jgi:serine/threonine protein kinase
MTLERDTLLHDRYRIKEILGQGGMGFVYRAIDERLGVEVAVKENLFTTDEYARQFRLEAEILARLRHPNLVRVTDHFVIENQGQYLVMDSIEGEDLRQRMDRLVTIPEDEVILIGIAMCDAISHLHSRNPPILHRDIKPGNVKITSNGHIYLVDFGLAKIMVGTEDTTTGARAMTPGYSPPEQYGTARTDVRTDIYSLGATLYAAMTGVIPEDALARAMGNSELTPVRKRNPSVSRRLASVIEKAISIKVDDRFQTADEFRLALFQCNPRTLPLNGEILVEPPPVSNKFVDKKKPEEPITDSSKLDNLPVTPPSIPPRQKKEMGKGFWIFISFVLLLLLMAVVAVPYFWAPISNIITGLIYTPSFTSIITETPGSTGSTSLPVPSKSVSRTPSPTGTLIIPPARTATNSNILTPTSSPTIKPAPVFTPVGGGTSQIAFSSDRTGIPQIFISNTNEENPLQITNLNEGACQPDWSPDGQQLVFISPCGGNTDSYSGARLYLINLDGSNLIELPTIEGGDYDPAWSQDGTRIAFTSLRDGYTQIYMINLESNSVERLTHTDASQSARQPAWNPMASEIAYSQKKYDAWEIWVMTDVGTGAFRLVLSSPENWDFLPDWSPNGDMVLFSQSKKLSATSWLMSFPIDRSSTYAVPVIKGEYASAADYSPDGLWLAFENTDGVNTDIYMLDLSNGLRQRITSDPAKDFDPSWRP